MADNNFAVLRIMDRQEKFLRAISYATTQGIWLDPSGLDIDKSVESDGQYLLRTSSRAVIARIPLDELAKAPIADIKHFKKAGPNGLRPIREASNDSRPAFINIKTLQPRNHHQQPPLGCLLQIVFFVFGAYAGAFIFIYLNPPLAPICTPEEIERIKLKSDKIEAAKDIQDCKIPTNKRTQSDSKIRQLPYASGFFGFIFAFFGPKTVRAALRKIRKHDS